MKFSCFLLRCSLGTLALCAIASAPSSIAQQSQAADVPVIHAESDLVFLDVTVVNKAGIPVVTGLSKDDFTITEDKKPQRIFSFEAPEVHTEASAENPDGKAPGTIFVLDVLNSEVSDFAQLRQEVRHYLASQPETLAAPAEIMVVGNVTLDLLQGYTRSRNDLLFAIDHLPPSVPFKQMKLDFSQERTRQTYDAVQQIVLQNKGVPGRKNIVWVGRGCPAINIKNVTGKDYIRAQHFIHGITNMLVEARMSLFVIYPSTKLAIMVATNGEDPDQGNGLPFSGDINFADFVRETGGQIFYNRNDIAQEIVQSQQLGSNYYTLTYQPTDSPSDGRFRKVHVSLKNPDLRAITKIGYYATDPGAMPDPRNVVLADLAQATHTDLPLTSLDVRLFRVVRFAESRTARFTLQLSGKDLAWETAADGKKKASLLLCAVSRTGKDTVVASRVQSIVLTAEPNDPTQLTSAIARVSITVPFPPKAQQVRVIVETEGERPKGGLIGAVDVSRPVINAAPEAQIDSIASASQTVTKPAAH